MSSISIIPKKHDIQWFELEYHNIIPEIGKLTKSQKDLINYLTQGTLFIGRDLYAVVLVSLRYRHPNILINPFPPRIYLINVFRRIVTDSVDYPDATIRLDERLLVLTDIDIYKPDSPRMTDYIIYGITNSARLQKLCKFKLQNDNTSYIISNNTFVYLDPQNYLGVFKFNPDANLEPESDAVIGLSTQLDIPDLNTSLCPIWISNFSEPNNYLVLEYSKYEYDENYEGPEPMFLIDMTVWPPQFKGQYLKAEIDPSFGRNYINNYIGRDHKPANILNVFPELFTGMSEKDIAEYVLDFQLVKLPDHGEPDGVRHTYEIVVLAERPTDDSAPKLPISGHCINNTIPGAVSFKIINTHRGMGQIDCGPGNWIFSAVENEYRQTLTRFRVSKSLFTSPDLSKFIHPFGRLIYSRTGKDGILELKHNRTQYKNIIQGYYIFIVLPATTNNPCEKQTGFRIKIIGYYPQHVGQIIYCAETGDEFVIHTKCDLRNGGFWGNLTCFYSTLVRRMKSRFNLGMQGHLPEHLINNISRFYVINKYRYDIRHINQKNYLVPLLKL